MTNTAHTAPIIPLYKVEVAATTGEWLAEPELIGQISEAEHNTRQDTDSIHYDMIDPEVHSGYGDSTANVAIEEHMVW